MDGCVGQCLQRIRKNDIKYPAGAGGLSFSEIQLRRPEECFEHRQENDPSAASPRTIEVLWPPCSSPKQPFLHCRHVSHWGGDSGLASSLYRNRRLVERALADNRGRPSAAEREENRPGKSATARCELHRHYSEYNSAVPESRVRHAIRIRAFQRFRALGRGPLN